MEVSLHEVPLTFAGEHAGVLTVAPRDGEARPASGDVALLDELELAGLGDRQR